MFTNPVLRSVRLSFAYHISCKFSQAKAYSSYKYVCVVWYRWPPIDPEIPREPPVVPEVTILPHFPWLPPGKVKSKKGYIICVIELP